MLGMMEESVKHLLPKDMRESATLGPWAGSRHVIAKLLDRMNLNKHADSSPRAAERAMIVR
jgi:hypothetical protein